MNMLDKEQYKSAVVWFGVNRNSQIQMFLDEEPKKNNITGKYEGSHPFVNSLLYDDLKKIVQQTKMTFDSEVQCLEVNIKK